MIHTLNLEANKIKPFINTLKNIKFGEQILLHVNNEGLQFHFLGNLLLNSYEVFINIPNNIPEDEEFNFNIDPQILLDFIKNKKVRDKLFLVIKENNYEKFVLVEELTQQNAIIKEINNEENKLISFGNFKLDKHKNINLDNNNGCFNIQLRYLVKLISSFKETDILEFVINNDEIKIFADDLSVKINKDDKLLNELSVKHQCMFNIHWKFYKKILNILKTGFKNVNINIYDKLLRCKFENENNNSYIIVNFIINKIN